MLTETTTWRPIAEGLPDADLTVQIACDTNFHSEPVWIGFHDGQGWREANGEPAFVTHWAPMLVGPAALQAVCKCIYCASDILEGGKCQSEEQAEKCERAAGEVPTEAPNLPSLEWEGHQVWGDFTSLEAVRKAVRAAGNGPDAREPVALVIVHKDAEDEFFWSGKGALLELPPGEYDLYLAAGVAASEAPRYEQCGEAVVSPEYGVLQMSRHIGFLALADDDRMRGHRIEAVYRRVTDGVPGTLKENDHG